MNINNTEIDEKLYEGSHPLVIEAAKKNNRIALSILNTKKLSGSELEFVIGFIKNNIDYIFFDVQRIDAQNKYIFIKPYTTEYIEIFD